MAKRAAILARCALQRAGVLYANAGVPLSASATNPAIASIRSPSISMSLILHREGCQPRMALRHPLQGFPCEQVGMAPSDGKHRNAA